MDVRDHMTRNPVTVSPTDSLRKAWLLMRQARLRRLPVLDDKRVIGIVTDRDIWERCPAGIVDGSHADSAYLMDHLRVMGVMSLQPVTVAPTTSVVEAASLLRTSKVGALLIVEAGECIGIVTKGDLIDALIEMARDAAGTAARLSASQS